MKDPMFDAKETAGIPDHVVEALKEAILAAQKFGSASGSNKPMSVCQALMRAQQEQVKLLLVALTAEFTKRYEAGLEMQPRE